MNAANRRFARHYIEMLVAMFVGMVALGAPFEALVSTDSAAVKVSEMGVTMTIGMVAWMRYRGHGWRPCNEMAASMLLPTALALLLFAVGAATGTTTLLGVQHVVMLPAMLFVMLLRRDEYSRHHDHHRQVTA
jgi:hypothetical protein